MNKVKMENTYWSGNGLEQVKSEELNKLVVPEGLTGDTYLDAYIQVCNIYYDFYNNGGGNLVEFIETMDYAWVDEEYGEEYEFLGDNLFDKLKQINEVYKNKDYIMFDSSDSSVYDLLNMKNMYGIYYNLEDLVTEVIRLVYDNLTEKGKLG